MLPSTSQNVFLPFISVVYMTQRCRPEGRGRRQFLKLTHITPGSLYHCSNVTACPRVASRCTTKPALSQNRDGAGGWAHKLFTVESPRLSAASDAD